MCGIAGYIGKLEIPDHHVASCLKRMHQRGPDSTGVYRHKKNGQNVCLLHSRLNIIDLNERSNQPFKKKQKALVYNGEIYNYLELRHQLKTRQGVAFETQSDTEVLMSTLDVFGWKGLDECEGMWAFAYYDESDGALVLSRDRFGEKPLYLGKNEHGIYFGSEIKFLSALSGRKYRINEKQIYRYLVNGYKSLYKQNDTFFIGVEELPRGSVLQVLPNGDTKRENYWNPSTRIDPSLTYEDAVAQVREALIRSIKLRLRSDVPLAFCMSGGVDSNTLISTAKRVLNHDVHGFTIVNADDRYDESDLVENAVDSLGIRHTSISMDTEDFIPKLKSLIHYHDAPLYTITYYAHWLLMESIAAHGYRVSISGTAADELFTGYYDHHSMYLYEIQHNKGLFEASMDNWRKYIQPIVRNPVLQDPYVFINNPDERRHIYLNADKFAGFLKQDFNETFFEESFCDGLLRNRMLNELFVENVPVILHEDDLNAMYYSIENRSPFLDHKLFELCYSIPVKHLIRNGFNKKILRDAMKGIVPDKILNTRKKVGFNAPIYSFLDVNDRDVLEYLLNDSIVFQYIDKKKIANMITKPFLNNSESKFLFNFLNTKLFMEEFA